MANELNVNVGFKFVKGGITVERRINSLLRDIAGDAYTLGVQEIGTGAHELLVVSADIGTGRYLFLQNLDSTNYVEVGIDTTGTFRVFGRLKAGDIALVPVSIVAIYAQANTAAVDLEYCLIEL